MVLLGNDDCPGKQIKIRPGLTVEPTYLSTRHGMPLAITADFNQLIQLLVN